jgi:hypothetical protein
MSVVNRPFKPGYWMTRLAFYVSFALAWSVIMALTWAAIFGEKDVTGYSAIAIPAMCAMVVAILGIHRAYGSVDFKASMAAATASPETQPGAA